MAKHCVNHKNKGVQKVASELGVNPLVAASRIALWQDEHGVENFPTIEDLRPPVIEEIHERVVNLNDLVSNKAKPLFADTSKDKVENPNSTLFHNKSVITANEVLANIKDNLKDLTPHAQELIKRAGNLINKSNVKVKFIAENQLKTGQTLMQYNANTNTIEISKDRLNGRTDQEAAVGFLHEVVHAQTVTALAKDPKDRSFAEQELADVVSGFMKKYDNSDLADEYGFTDEFEFVSEFYANPEFRDAVKLESGRWWQKIMDAIRRVFDIPSNPEYQKLFDTVVNFVEGDNITLDGIKRFDRVFEQRLVEDSEHATLEKSLSKFIHTAQDKIDSVIKKLEGSLRNKQSMSKQEYLDNTLQLAKDLEAHEQGAKWKAVLGYVKSFNKSVNGVEKLLDNMKKAKNVEKDDLVNSLTQYQEFLGAYDLLPTIKELVSKGSFEQGTFTEEEQKDFDELKTVLDRFEARYDTVKKDFLEFKRAQMIKVFSDPSYNTEVETKHRRALTKEYNALPKAEQDKISRNEYIHKMLTTRDKEDYEADLRASAMKIINDPSMDISASAAWLSDNINTNSRIMQIVNNIITNARTKMLEIFKGKDVALSNLYDKYIAEKGNGKPSEINRRLLEKAKDGKWLLKGEYNSVFRRMYNEELIPLFQAKKEIVEAELKKGFTEKDIKLNNEVKALNAKISAWYKANTKKDYIQDPADHTKLKKVTKPKDKFKNDFSKYSKAEMDMLNAYRQINIDNDEHYNGNNSLVEHILGASFHRLPSIEKSAIEYRVEQDAKGYGKDLVGDAFKVKVDDIGTQTRSEKFDSNNKVIRDIKVHYRGDIDTDKQSLDLATIFRKEMFNGLNYASKKVIKPQLNMIVDIVEGKDYYKTDSAGKRLVDKFAKRNPEVVYKGQFSNEYKRITGLMERTLYDTFSEHGGEFLGQDVNKMTAAMNGIAASISMSFNLASGVTNAMNGFTQLFIESVGNDKIQRDKVAKAELKYLKELPNTLKDMTNPTKTSYFNQLLELYDVMGGLDPAEQEAIRNTIMRKFASTKMLNVLNEGGEHMMHSVITEAILDGIKVMNADGNYINKEGHITSKEEAASIVDMLYMDENGILKVSDKVIHSDFNLSTKYHEGGHSHVSLLVKKKVFDLFGVYDVKFKNEVSKYWYGKTIMMFKNFFISGAQYRFHGASTSMKRQEDLTDDDRFYSSAEKEYVEGTYTTFLRFIRHGVIPTIKELSLLYLKENYNNLSEYEKANLRKATAEFAFTAIILPSIGLLLAALQGEGDDDDNELLYFAIYTNRRLTQELAQFRNPLEMNKMLSNPVAGSRFLSNALTFAYDVASPINFVPGKNESVFGYLDENAKKENTMVKHGKKLVPIWTQMEKNYKQLYGLQFGKLN